MGKSPRKIIRKTRVEHVTIRGDLTGTLESDFA